jgi:hypothetical protein
MKSIRRLTAFVILSVALGAASTSVLATTLKRMSVADLSRAAHTVVRAWCVANTTQWDSGEIWTFTTFDVDEVWKGSSSAQITVRLLGGRAGNLTSTVSGAPRFSPGEEVVLFLEHTPGQDFSIVSWMQGTFRIGRDRATAQEFVTQDTAAFPVFDSASQRFESTGIRKMAVGALRSLVFQSPQAVEGSHQ